MIVFITGASSGFGAEMARTFVGHGHQVVISGRRKDRLDALAAELGDLALPLVMDVTDKASIKEALAHAAAIVAPDRRADQQRRPGAGHRSRRTKRRWPTGKP